MGAAGEFCPKQRKKQQSAGKVKASVFWDTHGIVFNYFEEDQTINRDRYLAQLLRLKDKKLPDMKTEKVLFYQDDTPCLRLKKTMAEVQELHIALLSHSPATFTCLQTPKKCSQQNKLNRRKISLLCGQREIVYWETNRNLLLPKSFYFIGYSRNILNDVLYNINNNLECVSFKFFVRRTLVIHILSVSIILSEVCGSFYLVFINLLLIFKEEPTGIV